MENILVAIDFSDASFNAISYAAFLANAFKVPITVVHAYSGVSAFDPIKGDKTSTPSPQLGGKNEGFLKNEMNGIVKKFTVKIDSIVKKGNPENVIREIAEKKHSDCIIMGIKGKGESNSIFGSTTITMINQTTIPLLVVPKEATYQTIETITIASDFSREKLFSNYLILQKIIERFEPFIEIVYVQKKNSKAATELTTDKLSKILKTDKYNHSFNVIQADDIEQGINEFLKNHPANLIVMIAGKRNFITKLVHHSHTKKMSYKIKIPLLVLHEDLIKK